MSTYIKLASLICGAGIGLGGGIPLALKTLKVSSNSTNLQEDQAVSSPVTSPSNSAGHSTGAGDSREAGAIHDQRAKSRETGNCVVLENSEEEIQDIMQTFHLQNDDYVAVSCQKTHTKGVATFSDWKGVLPTDLLTNGWLLKERNRFNVKTEIESENLGDYRITFNGDRMESPITGEWEDSDSTAKGRPVSVIKVLDSENT